MVFANEPAAPVLSGISSANGNWQNSRGPTDDRDGRLRSKQMLEAMPESVACPVCRSVDFTDLATIKSYERHVFGCRNCHFEFVQPFIASEQSSGSAVTADEYIVAMQVLFERFRPHVNRLADNRLRYYQAKLGSQPRRILEVGAGTGWMVKAYRERDIDAVGIELDERSIKYAQDRFEVSLIQADINAYPIEQLGEFDVVCSSQTLEHILTPLSAMANMAAAARPGGLVHVDVPNANSWGSMVRRWRPGPNTWGAISMPHHQVGYHPQTIRRLFNLAGLKVLQVSEESTDHAIFGQTILPDSRLAWLAISASRFLGHGYLLVALGRKDESIGTTRTRSTHNVTPKPHVLPPTRVPAPKASQGT